MPLPGLVRWEAQEEVTEKHVNGVRADNGVSQNGEKPLCIFKKTSI